MTTAIPFSSLYTALKGFGTYSHCMRHAREA